jgi:hypothetical protein
VLPHRGHAHVPLWAAEVLGQLTQRNLVPTPPPLASSPADRTSCELPHELPPCLGVASVPGRVHLRHGVRQVLLLGLSTAPPGFTSRHLEATKPSPHPPAPLHRRSLIAPLGPDVD